MNSVRSRNEFRFWLFFYFIFLSALTASGAIIETGNNIQFTPLHRIEDDVYAIGGKNISMDGFIDGDFTAFTYGVNINGEINGNANFFCSVLDHNGKVDRTLHAFVESANINGIVGRSLMTFSNNLVLSSNGLVERDLYAFCAHADVGGTVKGNATIHADEARIYGVIEGDLNIEARKITISPPAVIKGNLTYRSQVEASIDTSGGVVILGTTEWVPPETEKSDSGVFRKVVVTISELYAAFLFGLLILIPFRRYAKEAVEQLSSRFVISLAAGLITIVLFLFAVMVAIISTITFVIGYGLISGDAPVSGALVLILSTIILPISAFSAVSGGILFYIGKIILAFLIGYAIVGVLKKQKVELSKTQLLLGLIALALVFEIPYLGLLLYILGSLTGAGAIVLAVRKINFEISSPKSGDLPKPGS